MRNDVRIGGDVAIGADEEAGAQSDGRDVIRLSAETQEVETKLSLRRRR